jgi:hypothetical protein
MKRLFLIALLAVPLPAVAQVRPPVLTSGDARTDSSAGRR